MVQWYLSVQYHGGTNFDRTAGGPFITTSYDYDAPIDEYGMIFLLVFKYGTTFVFVFFFFLKERRKGNLSSSHSIQSAINVLEVSKMAICYCTMICYYILWDEFSGLARLPKWGHLKELHKAIKLCEHALLYNEPTMLTFGPLQEVKFLPLLLTFKLVIF